MKNLNDFIGLKKGLITIIDFKESEYKKNNLKEVMATCQCSRCKEVFEWPLNNLRKPSIYFNHNCPKCKESYRIEQINERLKGKKKGILEFIKFDHFEGTRAFVQCKCTRCGSTVVVRDDRFSKSNTPLSCTYCYPEYNSKQVRKRYEDLHGLYGEEYKQDKQIRYRLQSLKSGAIMRNFKFNISDEDAKELLKQNCYYCGGSEFIGLDRLDSKLDYTKENCVPCCKYCNLMKNNLSYNLFLDQIHKIFKNRISNSTTIENTSKDGSE